jgi:hypothetical protein
MNQKSPIIMSLVHSLAHWPWLPAFAAMPIMACSLIEKGPGLRLNENRPNETLYLGVKRASSRPRGAEPRMTKKTGNGA